ncbi:cytosine permease [Zophobihabitans entericus]|uniref:Cytosine permease n=1 Tax=Zophobihabitans entericus TaxID=1635327 RepID=A0A6G9IDK9_9GAMM|nr:cytosine permease [Zophobihabitans entericus]QIQ22316.1 cytosine permease [Zophobihabitans entericus]
MSNDNNYSQEAVPQSAKKNLLSLTFIMLSLTFFSASMWAGGTLGTGLTFSQFFFALFIGNLLLGIYSATLGYIGAKTGFSTHLLARFSFGLKGSWLPSFLLSSTQVGWFGVGLAMFAFPVSKATGINPYVLIAIFGILMTLTVAIEGIKALLYLSIIAVPAIAILGCYSVWIAVSDIGGLSELTGITPTNPISFSTSLTIVVGSFISAGTLTADFVRFGKRAKHVFLITIFAFLFGNSLMFIFGAAGAAAVGMSDISDVMIAQGLLIPAILVLGLNIWTTNDNALYASGLGMANITGLSSKTMSIVNGLLGTLCAVWLYNNFVGWLTFLSTAIPPIGGVLIADYLLHKKSYQHLANGSRQQVNWFAIAAVIIGVLCAKFLPGIVPVNSVLGSAISYIILNVVAKKAIYPISEVKNVG